SLRVPAHSRRARSAAMLDLGMYPGRRVALALACISLALPGVRTSAQIGPGARTPFIPRYEVRAPGAFDSDRSARRSARVRYRADAHILLPLLVTSVRIASRRGVGSASAEVRDILLPSGERALAYEFHATSVPERARGLDRLGSFREVVIGWDGESRETVYFGAMTVSKEETLDEARRAVGPKSSRAAYDVIDGHATGSSASATSFTVTRPGPAPNASAFFELIRAAIDPAEGKPKPQLTTPAGRRLSGYGFLGAFEALLQAVSASPERARGLSRTFVFGVEQRSVEIRDVDHDASRGREWGARAMVVRPEAVRRLACRIVAPAWKVDFATWIELPDAIPGDPAPLVAPLRVEYQPRAYLRLVFERES
ncbi:MAG: hypothetical protein AB1806_03105, partial [Acidobacteriota bacterium]